MFLFLFCFNFHLLLSSCEWKYEPKGGEPLKLIHSLISSKITNKRNSADSGESLERGVNFYLSFGPNLNYTIFIKQRPATVINKKTEFFVYENDSTTFYKVPSNSYELLEGFVKEKRYSSHVIGYVQDVFFYGKIQIDNTIFYIEKLTSYPEIMAKHKTTKNAIVFRRTFPIKEAMFANGMNYRPEVNSNNSKIFKRKAQGIGNMCSLLVLIDNAFITYVHGGKVKIAVKQVLLSIDEASSLYRSTDFDEDGHPDNIGFVVKYFIILKSSSNNRWIPKYSPKPIDGRYYMHMFSRFYLLEDVCLGVAFTGQPFQYAIVGISYAAVLGDEYFKYPYGGICDRPARNPYGLPLNTLVVSAKSSTGKNVPHYIFELSLCHEIGHSFGADHDTGECGGYLMNAVAPRDNQQRKHFVFSKCSRKAIMKTILLRGQCFDTDDTPYCGNGIIENDEECDCGTIRDCVEFDECCSPRGRFNSCKIKRELGYQCHPSQGICCTNECHVKDMRKYDLDCTNFQAGCPCNNSKFCKCGVGGYCTNEICSSEECTRIDAEECECPTPNSGCEICCQSIKYQISCTPASELTKILIDLDENCINKENLNNYKKVKRSTDFGFYKQFCRGEKCINLYFRKVKTSGYCVLFGQVGLCSTDFNCNLPVQEIYNLRHFNNHHSDKSTEKIITTNNANNAKSVLHVIVLVTYCSFIIIKVIN